VRGSLRVRECGDIPLTEVEFVTTIGVALSHKGRGRINTHLS